MNCWDAQRDANGNLHAAANTQHDRAKTTLSINIDHHSSGKPFAPVNWIDPAACAVGEMVYRVALASGAKITPQIASCLYTAVLTDTGSFSYAGTNDRTFELAQQLVRFGADPVQIAQSIYFSSPTSKMRLLGYALNNLN